MTVEEDFKTLQMVDYILLFFVCQKTYQKLMQCHQKSLKQKVNYNYLSKVNRMLSDR